MTVVQAIDLVTGEALVLATADSVETTTKARDAIQKYRSIIPATYRIRTLASVALVTLRVLPLQPRSYRRGFSCAGCGTVYPQRGVVTNSLGVQFWQREQASPRHAPA